MIKENTMNQHTKLVSKSLTGSIIFIVGEIGLLYGAIGGLLLSSAVITAFLIVVFFFSRFNFFNKFTEQIRKKSSSERKIFNIMLVIISMELLITESIVGGIIISNYFHLSQINATSLFIISSIAFLYIYLRSPIRNVEWSSIKLYLYFTIAIFIPIYIYIDKGLETVYHNLLHYHPQVLHIPKDNWLLFFIATTLVICSQLIFEIYKSEDNIVKKKLSRLTLVMISIVTVVMAFSTMSVISVMEKINVENINNINIVLIEEIASPLTYVIFLGSIYFFTLATFVSRLKEVLSNAVRAKIDIFKLIIIGISVLIFLFTVIHRELTILNLFLLFGVLNIPFTISLLHTPFVNGGTGMWFPSLIGLSTGILYLLFVGTIKTEFIVLANIMVVFITAFSFQLYIIGTKIILFLKR